MSSPRATLLATAAAAAPALSPASGGLAQRVTVSTAALPGIELTHVFRLLARLDARAVELVAGPGTELPDRRAETVAALLSKLDASGLSVCAVAAPGLWPVGSPQLKNVVAVAAALEVPFVRVFAPRYDPARPARKQLDELATDLDQVRASADAAGVELLIETAQETLVPSPELALRVIERAGSQSLGVVYDPGNMLVEGRLDTAYAVSLLGSLLRHVHAKNQRPRREDGRWSYMKTSLDRGQIDWSEIATALSPDYDGVIAIDHLSGHATLRRAEGDIRTLRRLVSPPSITPVAPVQ